MVKDRGKPNLFKKSVLENLVTLSLKLLAGSSSVPQKKRAS